MTVSLPARRVGLALSGGIARGPAHLGVLSVLEREGVEVAVTAGVSAGAIVAAIYCAGVTPERLAPLLETFGWRHIAQPVWPRRGLFSFARLERWLVDLIGDVQFADLPRPLAISATDMVTGEPVSLREGSVARAVHASCAVPGVVEPVEIGGRLLGDGGISNNLPARLARQMGADYVIGVDLFAPGLRLRLGPLGRLLFAVENLVRRSGGGLDLVDCLIVPELAGASYHRFGLRDSMIKRGVVAAELVLPQLRLDLGLQNPAGAEAQASTSQG
jgi:NTE family protein